MSSVNDSQTASSVRKYWRGLSSRTPDGSKRPHSGDEFPPDALRVPTEMSRRGFMKLMGGSAALATMAGCRWPKEQIRPYAHRPDGTTPGVARYFATAMELSGVGEPLLVTCIDGRPVKVDGNPTHAASNGACSIYAQASILGLYDPDRSKSVIHRDGGQELTKTMADFATWSREHFGALRTNRGKGLMVLGELTCSPSLVRLREQMRQAMPEARWYTWEPINRDAEHTACEAAFGTGHGHDRALPHLDKADVIVCLGADPLGIDRNCVANSQAFAAGRASADQGTMSRLYVAEPSLTVTGGMADVRVPVRACELPALAADILYAIDHDGHAPETSRWASFVEQVAADLLGHRGAALVMGNADHRVQLLCLAINQRLGCRGKTVTVVEEPWISDQPRCAAGLESLCADLDDIDTLVILGGNPVYTAPVELELAKKLTAVPTTVHVSEYRNETSRACTWHVPAAHYLESWGDTRSYDGTYSVTQPLIDPLYNGKTAAELVSMIVDDEPKSAYDIARQTFDAVIKPAVFEPAWRQALDDGFVKGTAWPTKNVSMPDSVARETLETVRKQDTWQNVDEFVFTPSYTLYDGRFANNAWLHELPDPLTKLTWDNALLISIADADKQGLTTGDVVEATVNGRTAQVPVYVMPGQARGSYSIALGYGRTAAGNVGNGVGVNVYPLHASPRAYPFDKGAGLSKRTGRSYKLACTQDHHLIDAVGAKDRDRRVPLLIREASLEHYQHHPDFAAHMGPHVKPAPLWEPPVSYDGHRWAMAIDLNLCTGCGACSLSCQAENNVPPVGKKQVLESREMHWLRVDRYFNGDAENPQVVHQPMMCLHCETAPCEQVCPVAATQHDEEGLNAMVYNRCVGTRYCSNNCPFKVRRFNFFAYDDTFTPTEKMRTNPQVTIRSRGVMEKCTYCVQRIAQARIKARRERQAIDDGAIVPACAAACPTGAIVFGDLNDSQSRIAQLHKHQRAYHLLEELALHTRTAYLARIRNTPGGKGHSASQGHPGTA